MSKEITIPPIAGKLNSAVLAVTGQQGLQLFERAYLTAQGMAELRELLTPDYMAPIMQLQGSRLGFKTDKDKNGGYPMAVVKDCLIEAVLMGLQPYGNQFNIIAGNCYMTKEGAGFILNNMKGLKYDLVCEITKINQDKSGAMVNGTISWTINGESFSKVIPIPVKMDQYTSVDAIIGKATRKGRAWLISHLTGVEFGDGEVEEGTATVVESKINKGAKKSQDDSERERQLALINDSSTIDELEYYLPSLDPELRPAFDQKHAELLNAKSAKNGK